MRRVVHVHPQFLGPALKQHIKDQCRAEVQGERAGSGASSSASADGTSSAGVGFIILVIAIDDSQIGKGVIDHLTGRTRYEVEYDAIVFRPFKNEVLDTAVKVCTSEGIFAEAGPLDLFVSRHYIPNTYEFRAEDASWVSPDTGAAIRSGGEMRVKILGANATGQVAAIATINEPFLGVL